MTPRGFPHSEIPGSTLVCSSPRLIAAYHVLHRLLTPRHPPCALSSLTTETFSRSNPILKWVEAKATRRSISRASRMRHNSSEPIRFSNNLVEDIGFEPTTSALQGRRSPN